MSYFRDVQAALDSKLSTIGDGLAIAWENTEYTPVLGTPWIRPTLLTASADLMDLDNLQMQEGIYQVDVFYPVDKGPGALLAKLDELYDLFKSTTTLQQGTTKVYIKQISRLNPSTEDAWYMGGIEVNFKTYSN